MGSKVALKGLVLFLEGLEFVQLAVPEVLTLEHLFLTRRPALVDLCLVLELLGQVFQPFESARKCITNEVTVIWNIILIRQ